MDRSAPNPIPNSWREEEEGGQKGGEETVKEREEGEWRYHV